MTKPYSERLMKYAASELREQLGKLKKKQQDEKDRVERLRYDLETAEGSVEVYGDMIDDYTQALEELGEPAQITAADASLRADAGQ